jgi:hypothetical protein
MHIRDDRFIVAHFEGSRHSNNPRGWHETIYQYGVRLDY